MPEEKAAKRKSRADGAATKQKLLAAASRLISRKGFAATTSKEVARAAGADLASVNYHFGSRKGLFEKALIAAHHDILPIEELKALAEAADTPEEKIRRILRCVIGTSRGPEAWKFRLIFRGLFETGVNLEPMFIKEVFPKLGILRVIASETSGIPEDDPELAKAMFCTMAPVFTMIAFGARMPDMISPLRDDVPDAVADYIAFFTTAGLKAAGERWRAGRGPGAA